MSVRMPTEDRFGIPDHLLDMVRIPGYVELSDDTTATCGAAAAMAIAEAGVHVDRHPQGLSDDEYPGEFPDDQDSGDENEDPEPVPDSPDESVPMEFEVDDVPREVDPLVGGALCAGRDWF
jgi:hypothetical protein